MPRDTAQSGLPPRTDVAPAPSPFMSVGAAANIAIDQIIGAMERPKLVPDCSGYFQDLRDGRLSTCANLQKLGGFVAQVLADAPGKPDPTAYLTANASKLNKMFESACMGDGPCPPHLVGIQASDFAIAISALEVEAAKMGERV